MLKHFNFTITETILTGSSRVTLPPQALEIFPCQTLDNLLRNDNSFALSIWNDCITVGFDESTNDTTCLNFEMII